MEPILVLAFFVGSFFVLRFAWKQMKDTMFDPEPDHQTAPVQPATKADKLREFVLPPIKIKVPATPAAPTPQAPQPKPARSPARAQKVMSYEQSQRLRPVFGPTFGMRHDDDHGYSTALVAHAYKRYRERYFPTVGFEFFKTALREANRTERLAYESAAELRAESGQPEPQVMIAYAITPAFICEKFIKTTFSTALHPHPTLVHVALPLPPPPSPGEYDLEPEPIPATEPEVYLERTGWGRGVRRINPLPPKLQKEHDHIQNTIREFLMREVAALKEVNLPLPTQTAKLSIIATDEQNYCALDAGKMELGDGHTFFVRGPAFDIPHHGYCHVEYGRGYIVLDPSAPEFLPLKEHTLLEVVTKYPNGKWVTGNPYAIHTNCTRGLGYEVFSFGPKGYRRIQGTYEYVAAYMVGPFKRNWKAVSAAPPLIMPDVHEVERRQAIIRALTDRFELSDDNKHFLNSPERSIDSLLSRPLGPPSLDPELTTVQLVAEKDARAGDACQFLDSLHRITHPLIFELVSDKGAVTVRLSFTPADRATIEAQIKTHLPHFDLAPASAIIANPFHMLAAAFNPKVITRTLKDFSFDPYSALFKIVTAAPEETTCFQVILFPIHDSLNRHYKTVFEFEDNKLQRHLHTLERKSPTWQVSLKLFSTNPATAQHAYRQWLLHYQTTHHNWRPPVQSQTHTITRSLDPWNLVSTRELAAFVHIPDPKMMIEKTKPVPEFLTKEGLVLGVNEHRGRKTEVRLPEGLRDRHMYIVGASGSGKSTVLINMIKQDIEAGRGFAVIDPHGDLVGDIMPHIPADRIPAVVYFNAPDREHPISLNPLVATTEEERETVTANFMVLFTRLFGVKEAPRLLHILRHAVLTLLESGGKTFLDIRTLLVKEEFRTEVLASVHNPFLLEFWEEEFSHFPANAVDPIINKLSQFRLNSIVRNVLGQPETAVDFPEIMRTSKMFLANLAQGEIQQENTILLGSLLVSQIQLAAMSRAKLPKEQRTPFTLYIDEFQNFTGGDSSAFEKILSEARKYNLRLVLAHQFTSQLPGDITSSILGNVFTMCVFRVGLEDAKLLQRAFPGSSAEDLQNFEIGEAIARCGKADDNFNLRTYPPPPKPARNFIHEVIEYSRTHYGKPPRDSGSAQRSPKPPGPSQPKEPQVQSAATPEPEPPVIDPWQ